MPYKIVSQKIRAPTLFSSLRKEDGTQTQSWRESAEVLMGALLPDDCGLSENEHHRAMVERNHVLPENDTHVEPFTPAEVESAIVRQKNRKAPGPDGIQVEVLLQLLPRVLPVLTEVYNDCLKEVRFPTC